MTSPQPPTLHCPLCEYNLTGLAEPRCPECGHDFAWADLADPARQRLRWFFEHRTGLRGFLGTQLRLALPWRFWRTVRPEHPIRAPRLLLFFGLSLLSLAALPVLATAISAAFVLERSYRADRWTALHGRGHVETVWRAVTRDPVAQAYRIYPPPSSPAFWRVIWTAVSQRFTWGYVESAGLWVWPAATIAGLLIAVLVLRQTFSRARVRKWHMARMILYCADPFPLALTLTALVLAKLLPVGFRHRGDWPDALAEMWQIAPYATGAASALMLIRLGFAFRLYLGRRGGWLVILTAAIIAGILGYWMTEYLAYRQRADWYGY